MTDEDMISMIAVIQYRQVVKRNGGYIPPMIDDRPSVFDKIAFHEKFKTAWPNFYAEMMEDAAAILSALDRVGAINHD
jgi:hypothetical protein